MKIVHKGMGRIIEIQYWVPLLDSKYECPDSDSDKH